MEDQNQYEQNQGQPSNVEQFRASTIFIPGDSYSLDSQGNVMKNGVQTICMFAERFPVEKIQPAADTIPKTRFITFPCTTRCPKCSVLLMQEPGSKDIKGMVLQIACNGVIDQFDLPMPKEAEQTSPVGMSAVK